MQSWKRILIVATAIAALALVACDKKGAEGAGDKKADKVEKAEPAKKGEPEKKAEPAKKAEPEKKVEPAAAEVKTVVNKETLAKAYEEIYCAQKRGETDKILDISKKYGFETPASWAEAWKSTSDDPDWQAALTKRVMTKGCK